MILLTNGCSWTFGGSLGLDSKEHTEQRLKSVWPYHLGKLMNADEVVQLAIGCGSNQRIVRTTFEWLLAQSKERLADTVAIIQWTEPARYEYYDPVDYDDILENIPDRWARVKVGVCLQSDHTPDGYKFAYDRSQRRFETTSHQEDMYRIVTEMSALAKIFETFGVTYYYWNHTNQVYMFPQEVKDFYINNFPWVDDPTHPWNPETDTSGWVYGRISPIDSHPNLQGHIDLANIIYEQIKAKH